MAAVSVASRYLPGMVLSSGRQEKGYQLAEKSETSLIKMIFNYQGGSIFTWLKIIKN